MGLGRIAELMARTGAVMNYGKGVSPHDLLAAHLVFTDTGAERIRGPGAEQYDLGGRQAFEEKTAPELLEDVLEELLDAQNYLTMIAVRMIAAASKLEAE